MQTRCALRISFFTLLIALPACAHSVVTKDVAAGAIVGGHSAKPLQKQSRVVFARNAGERW